jgi:hypothetical protein
MADPRPAMGVSGWMLELWPRRRLLEHRQASFCALCFGRTRAPLCSARICHAAGVAQRLADSRQRAEFILRRERVMAGLGVERLGECLRPEGPLCLIFAREGA